MRAMTGTQASSVGLFSSVLLLGVKVFFYLNLLYLPVFLIVAMLSRFITIFTLSAVVNLMRRNIHPIGWNEQFIMAYGGLRGAVGFSLVR